MVILLGGSGSLFERVTTFGIETTLVETRDFAVLTSLLTDSPNRSVFFCNVHMLMLAQDDMELASAMNNADIVFADGTPIGWLQRRLTGRDAKVIQGYEIMLAVCERAARNGEKVGFLGSSPDVMKGLVKNLCMQFENLNVAYQVCPPFVKGELISGHEDLQTINESGIRWLFIGLGCPKQEKWISRYNSDLQCSTLGVGAAFDWLSGTTSMPPAWMKRYALAWLYRLFQNPHRMFHRYIKYNTKFVMKAFKIVIMGK